MFLSAIEDSSNLKIVVFNCVFTNIYFGIILIALHLTNAYYSIGKYQFFPAIVLIFSLETVKYFLSQLYFSKASQPILGRFDNSHKKNYFKNKLKELVKCAGIMITMIFVYYTTSVLFGAQVFSRQEETFMLSLLLCVLTIYPACLNIGSQTTLYLIFGMKANTDLLSEWLLKTVQLTLFGCWLGAFVIPLDWDRPWQEWPIPCAVGAMVGFMTSSVLTLLNLLYVERAALKKTARKIR